MEHDDPGRLELFSDARRMTTWLRRRRQVRAILTDIAQRLGIDELPRRYGSYQGLYAVWRKMRLAIELREDRVVRPRGRVAYQWTLSVRVRARLTPMWFRFTRTQDTLELRLGHYTTHDLCALGAVLPPEVAHHLSTQRVSLGIRRSGLTHDILTSAELNECHDDFVHQACDTVALYIRLVEHLPATTKDLGYRLLEHTTDEDVLSKVYAEILARAQHEERFPRVLRRERVLREAVSERAPSQVLMHLLEQDDPVLPLLIERAAWDEARALAVLEAIGDWSPYGLEHQRCALVKVASILGPHHIHERWAARYPGAMFPLLKMQWPTQARVVAQPEVLAHMPCAHLIRWAIFLTRHDAQTGQALYTSDIVRLAESRVEALPDYELMFDEVWRFVEQDHDIMDRAEWFELMMRLIPPLPASRTGPVVYMLRARMSAVHLRGLRIFCNDPAHIDHPLLPKFRLLIRTVDVGEEQGPVGHLSLSGPNQGGQLTPTAEGGSIRLEEE